MNHRGMESLQFLKLDNNEHVIQFIGKENDLGTVVQNSGVVTSMKDEDFTVEAEKVSINFYINLMSLCFFDKTVLPRDFVEVVRESKKGSLELFLQDFLGHFMA